LNGSIFKPLKGFNALQYLYAIARNTMMPSNDPLHGKTLEVIVTTLVHHFGWEDLGRHINIKCFTNNPSISSSLRFLRKTPWARKKVEDLYIASMC